MNPPRIAKYFRYQHPALPLPAAANWLAQSKRSKRILFVGPNGLGGPQQKQMVVWRGVRLGAKVNRAKSTESTATVEAQVGGGPLSSNQQGSSGAVVDFQAPSLGSLWAAAGQLRNQSVYYYCRSS